MHYAYEHRHIGSVFSQYGAQYEVQEHIHTHMPPNPLYCNLWPRSMILKYIYQLYSNIMRSIEPVEHIINQHWWSARTHTLPSHPPSPTTKPERAQLLGWLSLDCIKSLTSSTAALYLVPFSVNSNRGLALLSGLQRKGKKIYVIMLFFKVIHTPFCLLWHV